MIIRNLFRIGHIAKASFNNAIDRVVQNGLACTPADLLEMTNKGIPISPANLGLAYQDGVSRLDFTPPLEYQRGKDIGDMWEAKQDMRGKFKDALGKVQSYKDFVNRETSVEEVA